MRIENNETQAVGGITGRREAADLRPCSRRVIADPQSTHARAKIEFAGEIGVHGQPLPRVSPIGIASHDDSNVVLGPAIALVGGREDIPVPIAIILADRGIDHLRIFRIGRDAFDAV
jgi:hypothetical protein